MNLSSYSKLLIIGVWLLFSSQGMTEDNSVDYNSPAVTYSWDNYTDWYFKKSEAYRGWKYIVIHHSATSKGSVKSFHRYHTKQGYGGIAYHFVIGNGNGMKDGKIQQTFRWKQQIAGTHVSVNSWEHNVFGIGVCLVGNLEKTPPTDAQIRALKRLIVKLKHKYLIRDRNILGHKHVRYDDASGKQEQTACPGKRFSLKRVN
jgi:N-acetyl-anhydromuramyl-L-alanine amidase AmpD